MPPGGVVPGLARIALVFARLMVNGEDRGVRPFLVTLATKSEMCEGVTARFDVLCTSLTPI